MLFNQVVAWIGPAQAHVIHFNPGDAESKVIRTRASHARPLSESRSKMMDRDVEATLYFDDIANAIQHSREIFIVGPGPEKLEFMSHLAAHYSPVAEKVVNVSSCAHASDDHLLAYAREYFVHASQIH